MHKETSWKPPTQDDHKWNPNATKIAIPISDEGMKDGDPAQQADDTTSIEEATTTVSTLVLFQSECTARPTAVQPVFNPTSRISHSVQTVCKALRLATVLVTPSVRRTLAVKCTSSHPEAAVQADVPPRRGHGLHLDEQLS